jgi:DNA-directed RNA polymerase specialized sigma subunit
MNVKQWLGRARYIDLEISALEQDRKIAVDRLTRITQSYDSDGAQTSPDPHKFDRIAEYDEQIQQKILELLETKSEIKAAIAKVEDGKLRCVLLKHYIDGEKWEKIALDMNYSYMHVTRLHGYALNAVQKHVRL